MVGSWVPRAQCNVKDEVIAALAMADGVVLVVDVVGLTQQPPCREMQVESPYIHFHAQ